MGEVSPRSDHEHDGRRVDNHWSSGWIPHRRAGPTLDALTTMRTSCMSYRQGVAVQVSGEAELLYGVSANLARRR
jgi:hypothetical protein